MRSLLLTAGILAAGGLAGFGLVRGVTPTAAVAAPPAGQARAEPEGPERLSPPPEVIDESSGLAASLARPGWLWTHNDSAGGSFLARYDPRSKSASERFTAGVPNRDWEDLASFEQHGRRFLLVADTGDNTRSRADAVLHFLEEPAADADPAARLPVLLSVPVSFADGARDCEAVAVDVSRGLVLLGSKEIDQRGKIHGASGLYELPLPEMPDAPAGAAAPVSLARVAVLPTLMPTGMDVSRRRVAAGDLHVRRRDALLSGPRPILGRGRGGPTRTLADATAAAGRGRRVLGRRARACTSRARARTSRRGGCRSSRRVRLDAPLNAKRSSRLGALPCFQHPRGQEKPGAG